MSENLAIEGRMSVRSPMQWSPEPHGGFTTGEKPCRPLAEGDRWGPAAVNVHHQRRDPDSLLNWMERLIRRRRECPELGWGSATVLDAGDPAVLAHRADRDGSTVVALHNLAGREAAVRLALDDAGAEAVLVDLFEDDDVAVRDDAAELSLPPYGARWLRLRRRGQRIAP